MLQSLQWYCMKKLTSLVFLADATTTFASWVRPHLHSSIIISLFFLQSRTCIYSQTSCTDVFFSRVTFSSFDASKKTMKPLQSSSVSCQRFCRLFHATLNSTLSPSKPNSLTVFALWAEFCQNTTDVRYSVLSHRASPVTSLPRKLCMV